MGDSDSLNSFSSLTCLITANTTDSELASYFTYLFDVKPAVGLSV